MKTQNIAAELQADCHHLGSLPCSELLLHRNAGLPWFIVVPHSPLQDVLDLPAAQSRQVMAECAGVSAFIKQHMGFSKVNFAGLGNVVPQMHLHIIGRSEGDSCWPQPVWGNVADGGEYSEAKLLQIQSALVASIDLEAAIL